MKKKTFYAFLTLILCCVVFVACSNTDDNPQSEGAFYQLIYDDVEYSSFALFTEGDIAAQQVYNGASITFVTNKPIDPDKVWFSWGYYSGSANPLISVINGQQRCSLREKYKGYYIYDVNQSFYVVNNNGELNADAHLDFGGFSLTIGENKIFLKEDFTYKLNVYFRENADIISNARVYNVADKSAFDFPKITLTGSENVTIENIVLSENTIKTADGTAFEGLPQQLGAGEGKAFAADFGFADGTRNECSDYCIVTYKLTGEEISRTIPLKAFNIISDFSKAREYIDNM